MKRHWIVPAITLTIVGAALRILTWNSSSPAWSLLQNASIVGALICFYLGAGHTPFSLGALQRDYEGRARRSLFIGALALLILPFALWLLYHRYYAGLFDASN